MTRFLTILTILTCVFSTIVISPVQASSDKSYEQWLEQYGAWDRLENEYAKEVDKDSPELILKRAEVYLNLNSPAKTLEIIEMTPTFSDNATNADRLWLGGQAHRALGDLSKAVLWFTQASKFITNKSKAQHRFKAERDLKYVWHDVWLKMYWSYDANFTLSRSTQKAALNQIREVGQNVWKGSFWEQAESTVNPTDSNATQTSVESKKIEKITSDGLPVPPFISRIDTESITKALAAASLEKFEEAQIHLASISQEPVRIFWTSIIVFLQTGTIPSNLDIFIQGNFLKAHAFWAGNMLAPYSISRDQWLLGNPDSGPWTKFRNNLLAMPINTANKAIDNELGSMLISDQTAALLNSFKLAFSLSNGDFINTANTWNKIDKTKLPITLQLAGLLLFKDNLNNVLPLNPAESFKLYPILTALSGAAGQDMVAKTVAPFWITAPSNQLKKMSQQQWPMDKLLLLAYHQQQFNKQPSIELAKRSAFLFDDSSFGIKSILYLADEAVRAKKLQLGAFYLNKVDANALPGPLKVSWLDTKTRLELDSSRQEAALKTYKEMLATGEQIPVMTRLRMALIFQQRRDFEAAKEQLLAMWNMRASLTTTLQAETLFWLGEGEQAVLNTDKALDYYLHLAWQYPQENIWALTAMYRASLIYEKRGKYDTAKRLLNTVIRRADRKEQREAAKARINAIDKKMGKPSKSNQSSTLVYPF
jgi:hypothetical protein